MYILFTKCLQIYFCVQNVYKCFFALEDRQVEKTKQNSYTHQANRFHLHLDFIKMFKSKFLLTFCFLLIGIHFAKHFALQNAPKVAKCSASGKQTFGTNHNSSSIN